MLIKKRQVQSRNFFFFFSLTFVVTVFVSTVSIIYSNIITESSIILAKYLPFSQLHVARFQM